MDFASLPGKATIMEVGPRDGLQMEENFVPTESKIEMIRLLAQAGIPVIQATAFVHPAKVPQMADAEDLLAGLGPLNGTLVSALVLNPRGVERACGCRLDIIEVSISASDTHGLKNAGMDFRQAVSRVGAMIETAGRCGFRTQASLQCAFGCVHDGPIPIRRVVAAVQAMVDAGARGITLADTTGMADPGQIRKVLEMTLKVTGQVPVTLHLHDTRGLGLVNLVAGLEMGVTRFDTSCGGLGGCPFVPGAAGNIATEEAVHLLSRLGIDTGVDVKKVAECTRHMAAVLGYLPPGRLWRLLVPPFEP